MSVASASPVAITVLCLTERSFRYTPRRSDPAVLVHDQLLQLPDVVDTGELMNTGYVPFNQYPVYIGLDGIGTTYFDYA